MDNGYKQFRAAFDACEHGAILQGPVDCRHTYVNFHELVVESTNTTLPPAAIGQAMALGAQDGRTPSGDVTAASVLTRFIRTFSEGQHISPEAVAAHSPKQILLAMGDVKKSPATWAPHILPLQLITIGGLTIAGAPFELTTMVGRRLRASLEKVLGHRVICAGLTNAYAGYCTTFEEYQVQEYEGGHTMFGPYQCEALQQEFRRLAQGPAGCSSKLRPPDLSTVKQFNFQTGVVLDAPIIGKAFGDCLQEPPDIVLSGTLLEVEFCAGHPKNDLQTQRSYLHVERIRNCAWSVVATDGDLETEFEWKRIGIAASKVMIRWFVPVNAKGVYRIRHFGAYRAVSGVIRPYTVCTREFKVRSGQVRNVDAMNLAAGLPSFESTAARSHL
jgi:neutral ceramidase